MGGTFQVQHRQTLVMSSIVNMKQEKSSLWSSTTMLGNETGGTGRAQVPQKPLLHSR